MNRRAFLRTLPSFALASVPAHASRVYARLESSRSANEAVDVPTGPSQAEEGFVSLFDARTLSGWSIQEGPESAFYVRDGAIVVHEGSNFPTWLRSDRQYENFDFRCEFFIKGWTNSGVYIHAPEHGRGMWCGMLVNIFHARDPKPAVESCGSILPVLAPLKVNVTSGWNTMRILMDWPRLRVCMNDDLVQDVNCESQPELAYRLRSGYIGLESLSYPIRFRNLRIRELPATDKWESLYESEEDFAKWQVAEGNAKWEALGPVLRSDGLGYLATREKFRDFALQMYVRASRHSNGGIYFRSELSGNSRRHYEIQIHDVEGAHYPTGSLYGYRRAIYPRIEPEKWYLLQMFVKGPHCLVRINGETVMEYNEMTNLDEGYIELQAHDIAHWLEYKHIRFKRL